MDDIKITSNFLKDFEEILINEMRNADIKVDLEKDISLQYFNFKKKQIPQIPRKVLIPKNFSVPDEFSTTINKIYERAKTGNNLNPFLSKRSKDPESNDGMLNHWNIHHFHLGDKFDKSGFIKRTGPLLYAYIDDDNFHVLGVFDHGKWTDESLIKILHDNWPETIEAFKIEGMTSEFNFDEESLRKLRKVNIITFINIGENVYRPFGGGYRFSGISDDVVETKYRYNKYINSIEHDICNNFSERAGDQTEIIKNHLKKTNAIELHLKLHKDKDNFFIQDSDGIIKIPLD